MKKVKKENAGNLLARAIILNRILQTDRSPLRKTHTQIAKKHNCSVKTVVRSEQFIMQKLCEKVNVLSILININ